MTNRFHRRLGHRQLLLLVVLAVGCARLPDYARPRFHVPDNAAAIGREGFGYRALTIEDFQARELPPSYRQHSHRINAHSCISIRPAREMKGRITQGVYEGRPFFVGSIGEVHFEAVFVPGCSWWSPEIPAARQAYVLEHEQIHFALAELAARRLTREARREVEAMLIVNDSRQAVQAELQATIQGLARDAMEASFAEHTAFDEETSLIYDPRAQRWWLEEVTERLAGEDARSAE